MDYDSLREDLRFLLIKKSPGFAVAWHDPNFAVRFKEYLDLIEECVPAGSLKSIAESSLSLLGEKQVRRLSRNGFVALAPGIESWFSVGEKAGTPGVTGEDKVERLAEQVRMITSHIPFISTNFILGLDADCGEAPFELTKRFVERVPAAYPNFSLATSFGRSAPFNLELQRSGRLLNVPFHFLNHVHGMNVRPRHYSWTEFFDRVCDLMETAFSARATWRRFSNNRSWLAGLEQVFRTIQNDRGHRLRNWQLMRERLRDPSVRRYLEGESTRLPDFFVHPVRQDLQHWWAWLPRGALYHDPNAYLKSVGRQADSGAVAESQKARQDNGLVGLTPPLSAPSAHHLTNALQKRPPKRGVSNQK